MRRGSERRRLRCLTWRCGLVAASLLVAGGLAFAEWPDRPITFMVPFGPGGTTDVISRSLMSDLASSLGQPVLVLNRPGAQGTVFAKLLAQARPDGYSLGLLTSAIGNWQFISDNPPALKDFSVVACFGRVPFALVVRADSPIQDVSDLIALAKTKGSINFGSPGPSSTLPMLLLGEKAGLRFVTVNFHSGTEVISALLGGHVDAVMQNPPDILAHVKTGKLRVLAVASANRLHDLPAVPTFAELGFNINTDVYVGVGAPANLPESIRLRLETEILKIASTLAFQTRLRGTFGIEPAALSGEQYHQVIQRTVEATNTVGPQFRSQAKQ